MLFVITRYLALVYLEPDTFITLIKNKLTFKEEFIRIVGFIKSL